MILALIFTCFVHPWAHAEELYERPQEAGEVSSEGCTTGACFNNVNTTMLTHNDEADREIARRIMETDLAPAPLLNSDGKAVREK